MIKHLHTCLALLLALVFPMVSCSDDNTTEDIDLGTIVAGKYIIEGTHENDDVNEEFSNTQLEMTRVNNNTIGLSFTTNYQTFNIQNGITLSGSAGNVTLSYSGTGEVKGITGSIKNSNIELSIISLSHEGEEMVTTITGQKGAVEELDLASIISGTHPVRFKYSIVNTNTNFYYTNLVIKRINDTEATFSFDKLSLTYDVEVNDPIFKLSGSASKINISFEGTGSVPLMVLKNCPIKIEGTYTPENGFELEMRANTIAKYICNITNDYRKTPESDLASVVEGDYYTNLHYIRFDQGSHGPLDLERDNYVVRIRRVKENVISIQAENIMQDDEVVLEPHFVENVTLSGTEEIVVFDISGKWYNETFKDNELHDLNGIIRPGATNELEFTFKISIDLLGYWQYNVMEIEGSRK